MSEDFGLTEIGGVEDVEDGLDAVGAHPPRYHHLEHAMAASMIHGAKIANNSTMAHRHSPALTQQLPRHREGVRRLQGGGLGLGRRARGKVPS